MNKWKELQLLQNNINMISNSVIQKENKIKDSFFKALKNYYKHKYRILYLSNNNILLLGLRNDLPNDKKKIKISQSEMICCYEQVKTYFFRLRNDYKLLYRFIKSLNKNEEAQIAQLFVHFFFEDISTETNPSLLQLLKMLLQEEIKLNSYRYVRSFLEENTFLSLILHQVVKIKDIKEYYFFAFSKFFSDLEKNQTFIQLSLNNSLGKVDTSTYFKFELELVKTKKENQSMIEFNRASTFTSSSLKIYDDSGWIDMSSLINPSLNSENYIFDEILDNRITEKVLRKASQKKNESEVMKQFYLKCLQNIQNNPNIYSTEMLRKLFHNRDIDDLENYNNNIKTIVCVISKIVQIFADDFCIPETIRLICIDISDEFKKQYKDINQMYILSHVGKFFIDTLLIPLLLQPEINGLLVNNSFLSIPTRQTLTVISPILSKLFTFELFDGFSNILYTPFNSYLISLMPSVMEFLNKLIAPSRLNAFNTSLTQGNYQAFCIGVPEIIIMLDKVTKLFKTEEELKPYKDLPNVMTLFKEQTKSERIDEHFLFLSDKLSLDILEKFKIPQIKAKLITYPKEENRNYLSEMICAISNVFRLMPYTLSDDPISTVDLFNILHQKTLFFTNKNGFEKSSNLPLSWYTSYIQLHLADIPEEESKDDYQGLFEKTYSEVNVILNSLTNSKYLSSHKLNNELHFILKQVNEILDEKKEMKKLNRNLIIESLIESLTIEICFLNGIDIVDFEKKTQFQIPNNYDPNGIYLFNRKECKCIHALYEEAVSMSMDHNDAYSFQKTDHKCHFNSIKGFISKFKKCCFFGEETFSDMSSPYLYTAKNILDLYMEQILQAIQVSKIIKHYEEREKEEEYLKQLQSDIQEYILRYSWNSNSISQDLKSADYRFISYCKRYQWIHPVEHLKIPEECLSESNFELATEFLKKLDLAKTPNEIINFFQKTADILNKSLAFTSCKLEVGADDLNPIYIYLVIQCKPKHMVSQFNYCKLFLGQTNLLGKVGYLVTTIELIIQCISNLNHITLNISLEEFNTRCIQSESTPQ